MVKSPQASNVKYNPKIHHRRSIRLRNYDYRQAGLYFVTLCTHEKQCWFGDICNDKMHLNHFGAIVSREWLKSAEIRPEIVLDEWIVMPNHFHGIVGIIDGEQVGDRSQVQVEDRAHMENRRYRQGRSLGSIIAGFKSTTTKQINQLRDTPRVPLWQRNYYESVIRSEYHLEQIRDYIQKNPHRWQNDPEFSQIQPQNAFNLPF